MPPSPLGYRSDLIAVFLLPHVPCGFVPKCSQISTTFLRRHSHCSLLEIPRGVLPNRRDKSSVALKAPRACLRVTSDLLSWSLPSLSCLLCGSVATSASQPQGLSPGCPCGLLSQSWHKCRFPERPSLTGSSPWHPVPSPRGRFKL